MSTPEDRFMREIKRGARLLERCLDNEAVAEVAAANPEIMHRLDNLTERIREFLAAGRAER